MRSEVSPSRYALVARLRGRLLAGARELRGENGLHHPLSLRLHEPRGAALIRSKITTVVKKDEVKKLLKELKGFANSYVTIGLHEGAGNYPSAGAPSVVEVGLWNEFGTAHSPERSWLRSAIDESETLINKWRDEAIANIIFKRWPVAKALEMMGLRIQILIQNKIKSNVPPANAPSTLAAKKDHGVAPNTLIDSGLMLRSVTYEVKLVA